MERYIRLTERVDAGGRVFYAGAVVDTFKYPEVAEALSRRARRAARESPLDKLGGRGMRMK